MEKNYIETFELKTGQCDMGGSWRPAAVLEAMQETAGAHCAELGIGRRVMDGLGIAWVLSRSRVELTRVPRLGETVSVETYPLPNRHLFFPRVNVFRDAEDAVIGAAASLWVLLDVQTRRIVSHPEVLAHLPDNGDMPQPLPMPGTVRPLEGPVETGRLTPPYTDFDVNGHVNNTKYLDWCCNALGVGTMRENRLVRFDISYEAEVFPGAEIRTELTRDGGRFAFFGCAGERRCVSIGGVLEPRG